MSICKNSVCVEQTEVSERVLKKWDSGQSVRF